jgi:hypothetical protein
MRVVMMAALALTACAAPSGPTASERAMIEREQNDPALRARLEAAAEEGRRRHAAEVANPDPRMVAVREGAARDRQAATICEGRANMAAAQPVFGGFGITGVMMGVAAQEQARVEVFRTCLAVYQQTRVMPSF